MVKCMKLRFYYFWQCSLDKPTTFKSPTLKIRKMVFNHSFTLIIKPNECTLHHDELSWEEKDEYSNRGKRWVLFLKGWRISNPLPEQAWFKAKVKTSLLHSLYLDSKIIFKQLWGYMKTVGDLVQKSGSTAIQEQELNSHIEQNSMHCISTVTTGIRGRGGGRLNCFSVPTGIAGWI